MSSDNFDGVDLGEIEPENRVDYLGPAEVADEDRLGDYAGDRTLNDVTNGMLVDDAENPESWLQYNGNLRQTGYSPADRLTTDNIGSLSKEYEIPTEIHGLQTNPIIIPGDPPEMYFSVFEDARVHVRAVSARSGEDIWTFTHEYPWDTSPGDHNVQNRGVAAYGNNVYLGTADTKIVAIDRESGEEVFTTDVLLPGQQRDRSGITATPITYDGKVFTGQFGDSQGWSANIAVDADTGDILWSHRTGPERLWVGDTAKFSSAAAWMSPTVDPESNMVFVSAANPDPTYNSVVRPGPNKYSNSVLAYDADTGELQWEHQIVPHETWDYDVHTTPYVFDMEVGGEVRRVVATDWKGAWSYNIDVETGELVTRTKPFALQEGAFLEYPPADPDDAEAAAPILTGGTEWPPDAVSPKTGLRYIGSADGLCKFFYNPDWVYQTVPDPVYPTGGGASGVPGKTDNGVSAVNPATGEVEWTFSFPGVTADMSPFAGWPGGMTATAGGIVFAPSTTGQFFALDDTTGDVLWQVDAGGRMTSSPVVWDDPGASTQFVAVAADDKIVTYGIS